MSPATRSTSRTLTLRPSTWVPLRDTLDDGTLYGFAHSVQSLGSQLQLYSLKFIEFGQIILGLLNSCAGNILGWKRNKDKKKFVTQCFVLTAGHCMEANQPLKDVSVYLGRHIRSSGGTKYGVEEATFHPGWMKTDRKRKKMGMIPFDLLLLRLDRAVTFSPTISPVCLPTVPEDRDAKSYNQKCLSFCCLF